MDIFRKKTKISGSGSPDMLRGTKRRRFIRSTREQMVYLIIFVLFVAISVFVDIRESVPPETSFVPLSSSWTLETGADVDINNLPQGFHKVSLDLSGYSVNGKSLCLRSIDTNFTAYADGESIYDYHPVIPRRFGISYGMYVHTIPIPDNTKVLSVSVEPVFPDVEDGFKDVIIGDGGQYMTELFRKNLFSFGQSVFIIIIGIVFLGTGLMGAVLMHNAGIDFIAFGASCVLVGFVGFNGTMLLQVLTGRPELIRVLTYVCLIFLPFPTLSFFASTLGNSWSWFVSGLLTICLINFIAQLILTHNGTTDYYYLLDISHAVIVIALGSCLCLLVNALRKKTVLPGLLRRTVFGLSICVAGVVIDMLRYHFSDSNGSSVFTQTGVLIFTVLMCLYLIKRQKYALEQKNRDTMALVGEIAESFAKVIDMKDTYTNGHSMRVAKYTAMLTRELGYDEETVEKFYHIALLHDVGKIAVPREILNKPGKLTDEEYSIVKNHTTKGYELLKDILIIPDLAVGAQSHHERPDGKGYPCGLSGEDIPRVAQIIAVADCFDAMYSDRPYRKRIGFDKVVETIREVSGTQLTPDVVDAFMRLVERGELHREDDDKEEEDP